MGKRASAFVPNGGHVLMTVHDEGILALEDRLRSAQDAYNRTAQRR
ncbi:MAG: hypothetical protein K8R46_13615 [Pirellulales bacterium]|nr:hypothetical protein [Pirellulales bacterium]